MTPHKKHKNNKTKRNVKRAARIMYELKIRGFKQRDVAEELGMTRQAVSRSFCGLSTVSRVDEWIEQNLGLYLEDLGVFL